MKKLFAYLALALAILMPMGIYSQQPKPLLAKVHQDQGLGCKDCHGEGDKAPVETDQCLSCHESFEALGQRTKAYKPNPHANHIVQGGAECNQCHHVHKPSELVCLQCHQDMTMKKAVK